MGRLFASALFLGLWSLQAVGQGVPTVDSGLLSQETVITETRENDVALQQDRLGTEDELADWRRSILAELDQIVAQSRLPVADTAAMIEDLESGSGTAAASAEQLYSPEDANPAASQTFGDADVTVEEVIIRGAADTHHLPGVSAAGLSQTQWRALLQALIWQESRFNPFIGSPVGAWGLTQLMPGTAVEVGVGESYRSNPYAQVVGGATYLARMLQRQNGDIITALAAYNAGPGNVDRYGGVPPFQETQHYVKVIPAKYNEYLAIIGGPDALGTIDVISASGANFAIASHNSSLYGGAINAEIIQVAHRTRAIVEQIGATENPAQAFALNTYARAEMIRLLALKARVLAATAKPVSADALQQAAAHAAEREFMQFGEMQ